MNASDTLKISGRPAGSSSQKRKATRQLTIDELQRGKNRVTSMFSSDMGVNSVDLDLEGIGGRHHRSEIQKPKYRQTTLEAGQKVVVLEEIVAIGRELEKHEENGTPASIIKCLNELSKKFVSLETLEKTGIGVVVNRLKRHENDHIAATSQQLIHKWKETARSAMARRRRHKKLGWGLRLDKC